MYTITINLAGLEFQYTQGHFKIPIISTYGKIHYIDQTDMLVSGFPGRGYLSAASPMLVALCTCVFILRFDL